MGDRRLAILRHGKAEPSSPTGVDADRPLAGRGVRQAEWMARALDGAGFARAHVLSSPAERTWHTASIVGAALGVAPVRDDRLFLNSTVESIFEMLTEHGERDRLVIVGHNPTLSLAASVLTHGVGLCAVSLRTGAAAICTHAGHLEPGAGELLGVWRLDEK